jgi:hypothetical protein
LPSFKLLSKDMNGDGRDDLICLDSNGSVSIILSLLSNKTTDDDCTYVAAFKFPGGTNSGVVTLGDDDNVAWCTDGGSFDVGYVDGKTATLYCNMAGKNMFMLCGYDNSDDKTYSCTSMNTANNNGLMSMGVGNDIWCELQCSLLGTLTSSGYSDVVCSCGG